MPPETEHVGAPGRHQGSLGSAGRPPAPGDGAGVGERRALARAAARSPSVPTRARGHRGAARGDRDGPRVCAPRDGASRLTAGYDALTVTATIGGKWDVTYTWDGSKFHRARASLLAGIGPTPIARV